LVINVETGDSTKHRVAVEPDEEEPHRADSLQRFEQGCPEDCFGVVECLPLSV
jgi:hypothetical protein